MDSPNQSKKRKPLGEAKAGLKQDNAAAEQATSAKSNATGGTGGTGRNVQYCKGGAFTTYGESR